MYRRAIVRRNLAGSANRIRAAEQKAYQELMRERLLVEVRQRHAWELRTGVCCTCGIDRLYRLGTVTDLHGFL